VVHYSYSAIVSFSLLEEAFKWSSNWISNDQVIEWSNSYMIDDGYPQVQCIGWLLPIPCSEISWHNAIMQPSQLEWLLLSSIAYVQSWDRINDGLSWTLSAYHCVVHTLTSTVTVPYIITQ
jgi:hypothetical protein